MDMHDFENLARIQLCLQHFYVKSPARGCTLREILRLLLQTFHIGNEHSSSRRAKHYSVDEMSDFVVSSLPLEWDLKENLETDVSSFIQELSQTYRNHVMGQVTLGALLNLIYIIATSLPLYLFAFD